MTEQTRPQMGQMPGPEQVEALTKLASILQSARPGYIPITKSLEAIGIEPKFMDIMIGDEPIECMVIPLQELISKEWFKMSGRTQAKVAE